MEFPIAYNQRSSSIILVGNKTPNKSFVNQILNSSFDRLVIFKDKKTGIIDQRIVRYIPDSSYLVKHRDLSMNKVTQLDPLFCGFLEYLAWDGTPLYSLRILYGRVAFRVQNTNSSKPPASTKTSAEVCTTIPIYEYTQDCTYTDPEHTQNESCGDWVLSGVTYENYCYDDGTGAGGDGGSGGGGGAPSPPTASNFLQASNQLRPCVNALINSVNQGAVNYGVPYLLSDDQAGTLIAAIVNNPGQYPLIC